MPSLYLIAATLWAQDVSFVHKETFADHRRLAFVTYKTVAVPVTILKRDKLCSSKTSDGFRTSATLLGEQLSVTLGTIWLIILGCELLFGQLLATLGAGETFPMPGLILVGHTPFVNYPITFTTLLGKLILVARYANRLVFPRDETLVSDWLLADHAHKALLMPLFSLVFKLLHPFNAFLFVSSSEWFPTPIAASSEVFIVTIGAVDVVILWSEGLIHQRFLALAALEAEFMPMPVLV